MPQKFFVLFPSLLIILSCSLFANQPDIKIIHQTPAAITLEISFPSVVVNEITADQTGAKQVFINMPGLRNLDEEGYPDAPYFSRLITLQGKEAAARIIDVKKDTRQGLAYRFNRKDPNTVFRRPQLVDIRYAGLFRDIPLFMLTVCPVQVDPASGTVEIVSSLRFELTVTGREKIVSTRTAAASPLKLSPGVSKLLLNSSMVQPETVNLPELTADREAEIYKPGRYKISVKETGLYKITYDLLEQNDVPVDQIDPRRIRLTNGGSEIPIYIKGSGDGTFDPGDYFEFWGEKNRSDLTRKYEDIYNDPFSDINVYWLQIGETNGLRMVDESGALTVTNPSRYITPYAFTEKYHFEEDKAFVRFGHPSAKVDSAGYTLDHWFFDRGVIAVGSRTYKAYLPWPFAGFGSATVFVKTMMRGASTRDATNPLVNHIAQVWLNDSKVGSSGDWKDNDLEVITNIGGLGISQNAIKNGDNDLRIIMDQPGVSDNALLNWFEITYQRRYRADKDFIRFKRQENIPEGYTYQFEVDGFSSPDIELYKLGISKMVNNRVDYITADDNVNSYRISFQDEIFYSGIEYIALTDKAKKRPISIDSDIPWRGDFTNASLYDKSNSADYLIVTDALFYETARELKAYREQNGLHVEIVKVEDIYDEFNYGIKSPISIGEFLKYIYENWDQSHKLMYVLLVGSASYDYKQTVSSQRDFVPTFLFETQKYGSAASDFPYSLVSGDDFIPDIIVSRLPVESNTDLSAYIDKIKGYEAPENTGDWRNRALFISGNDGSTNEQFTGLPLFRTQNQRIINLLLPENYFSRKLNTIRDDHITGIDPNFGGTIDLIDQFDNGVALMDFYGHGGGGIWADVQLMNTDDADRLSETYRLPFIQSMTCFTGAFENPSINSLSDKLILAPRRGAIGALAASGVGWMYNDFALGWHLTDLLLHNDLTIGEAVMLGKIYYYADNTYISDTDNKSVPSFFSLRKSMVSHYNLLGDPYIKIGRPSGTLDISIANTQLSQGDTITVQVTAPFSSGTGTIELADKDREPIEDRIFSLNTSGAGVSFTIPSGLENQLLFIKAYAASSSGNQDAAGHLNLALNSTMFDSVVTVPAAPQIGDEINFKVYINSASEIGLVQLINLAGGHGTVYTQQDLADQGGGLWKTNSGIGPYSRSDTVYYDVRAYENDGTSHLLRRQRLIISDPRPDLVLDGNYAEFGGESAVALRFLIENRSAEIFSGVKISYYTDVYPPAGPAFDSTMIALQPWEKKTIEQTVPPVYLTGGRSFFIAADHDNLIVERDETNNIRKVAYPDGLFNISKDIGSTLDGVKNDTLHLGETAAVQIGTQGVTASSVLNIGLEEDPGLVKIDAQPGLTHVPLSGRTGHHFLGIGLANPNSLLRKPFYLGISLDSSKYTPDYAGLIYICRYEPKLSRWIRMDTFHNSTGLYTLTDQTGKFTLFHISDALKPVIEITVNGRQMHENMYVPANPDLAFILQDENGINLSKGLNILVDNDSLESTVVNIPDSLQNANAVSILSSPKLTTGQHTLSVSVQDVNGNLATKNMKFAVAGGFQLRVFGNYPNPFTDETIISFEIVSDGVVDEFSVRIYTVSGRMIREIKRNQEYPDEIWSPGYHEVKWDGRDRDLNLVANGVYFAVIAAKYKGETTEQTLKLAKLK